MPLRFEIEDDPHAAIDRDLLRLEVWGYDEGWPALHYDEFPLYHVTLVLAQMGGPVWALRRNRYGSERLEMSCSGELPVGEPLMDAIDVWFEDYLDWITGDYCNPQMNPDFPFARFNAVGEMLAARCRRELGAAWTVSYLPAALID